MADFGVRVGQTGDPEKDYAIVGPITIPVRDRMATMTAKVKTLTSANNTWKHWLFEVPVFDDPEKLFCIVEDDGRVVFNKSGVYSVHLTAGVSTVSHNVFWQQIVQNAEVLDAKTISLASTKAAAVYVAPSINVVRRLEAGDYLYFNLNVSAAMTAFTSGEGLVIVRLGD